MQYIGAPQSWFSNWNLLTILNTWLYPFNGFLRILWCWHELRRKNLIDRIFIRESLLNRNKFDPFLKRMVTCNGKWIAYGKVTRKRSWSKVCEPAQTVSKLQLAERKIDRESTTMSCSPAVKLFHRVFLCDRLNCITFKVAKSYHYNGK